MNKPFKNYVREQFEKHLDENLDLYVEGKLAASERCVLATTFVGNAWEKLSENKDMIIRSFVKCGITSNVDGSEDDQVNIRGLEGYKMPLPEEEFHLVTSSEEDDDALQDGILTDASSDAANSITISEVETVSTDDCSTDSSD